VALAIRCPQRQRFATEVMFHKSCQSYRLLQFCRIPVCLQVMMMWLPGSISTPARTWQLWRWPSSSSSPSPCWLGPSGHEPVRPCNGHLPPETTICHLIPQHTPSHGTDAVFWIHCSQSSPPAPYQSRALPRGVDLCRVCGDRVHCGPAGGRRLHLPHPHVQGGRVLPLSARAVPADHSAQFLGTGAVPHTGKGCPCQAAHPDRKLPVISLPPSSHIACRSVPYLHCRVSMLTTCCLSV